MKIKKKWEKNVYWSRGEKTELNPIRNFVVMVMAITSIQYLWMSYLKRSGSESGRSPLVGFWAAQRNKLQPLWVWFPSTSDINLYQAERRSTSVKRVALVKLIKTFLMDLSSFFLCNICGPNLCLSLLMPSFLYAFGIPTHWYLSLRLLFYAFTPFVSNWTDPSLLLLMWIWAGLLTPCSLKPPLFCGPPTSSIFWAAARADVSVATLTPPPSLPDSLKQFDTV